jgi:uncharacterized protein (TIGR02145 family)
MHYGYGMAIRCVSTGETPTAMPRISVSDGYGSPFEAMGGTRTYTVSRTNYTGTLTVTGKPSWITTASVSGSTLTITTAVNNSIARSATITLTGSNSAGPCSTTFTVSQSAGGNFVLYFNGDELAVSQWGNGDAHISNIVYTQFGSVIGFANNANIDIFNPMSSTPAGYTSYPNFTGTSTSISVSSSDYHNGSNIKAGKGDICKLVGLTSEQAQGMTEAQLDSYNSGWRLPTNQENIDFVGRSGQTDSGTSYSGNYGTGVYYTYTTKGSSVNNPNIATFQRNQTSGVTLLTAGAYYGDGSFNGGGSFGRYWSSTANSNNLGVFLNIHSSINPSTSSSYACGHTVRCVPN